MSDSPDGYRAAAARAAMPAAPEPRYVPVDLGAWYDNDGISCAGRPDDGAFNIWGNTFPAEELPSGGSEVAVGGVPFRFPPTADGTGNNLRCEQQRIPVPPGSYDWLYLLAAAERRSEDQLLLHFGDGTADPAWLRVSDFWPDSAARFGELPAFRCTRLHYPRHVQRDFGPVIWQQRVGVARAAELVAVELPDNQAIHLFALTGARTAATEAQ